MTKKKYYDLLEEYKKIVSQKEFNSDFYDNERFHEVQKKIEVYIVELFIGPASQAEEEQNNGYVIKVMCKYRDKWKGAF